MEVPFEAERKEKYHREPMAAKHTNNGMVTGEREQSVGTVNPAIYREIRRGFEEFMQVNFHETGFLSRSQYESQRRFIEEAAFDPEKFQEARQAYVGTFARRNMEQNLKVYYQDFIDPLDEAKRDGIISEKSYHEWVRWIRDPQRHAPEKKQSISGALPQYLGERRELAKKRADFRRQNEEKLKNVDDPELKDMIRFLTEDDKWFGDLEFTQRKNLLDRIRAGLSVEGNPKLKSLHGEAEKKLMEATKEPQPALHRDKVGTWLKRIFEEGPQKGASFVEMEKFVKGTGKGTLEELIKVWRDVAIKFWTRRKDPVFLGVKTEFVNTKGFLWMHYDERVAYVGMMKNQRDRAAQLRSRAWALIMTANTALDANGGKRWLNEYVFNGNHTLQELESIVNGNLAVRLEAKVDVFDRYEKAKANAQKHQGIRGMKVPEKSRFLKLHYDAQRASVEEMENRILELDKNRPDFLLIRYEMDRGDFDSAKELITEGKKKALSEADQKQLTSMEQYVKEYGKRQEEKVGKIEKTGKEAKEIDDLISSLPSDLQDIILSLAAYGSDCIRMFGWGLYNRDWCNRRGYLNIEREHVALHTGKSQALNKVRRQKRKGVVSETIQGETGEEEYVELSRTSATNVCLDIADEGAKSAFRETVHRTKGDHRAWYWTNVILHRAGSLMSLDRQNSENQKIYKIGKLLHRLEERKEPYQFRATGAVLRDKAIEAKGGKKAEETH